MLPHKVQNFTVEPGSTPTAPTSPLRSNHKCRSRLASGRPPAAPCGSTPWRPATRRCSAASSASPRPGAPGRDRRTERRTECRKEGVHGRLGVFFVCFFCLFCLFAIRARLSFHRGLYSRDLEAPPFLGAFYKWEPLEWVCFSTLRLKHGQKDLGPNCLTLVETNQFACART